MISTIAAIIFYTVGLFLRWRAREEASAHTPVTLLTLLALIAHAVSAYTGLVVAGELNLGLLSASNVIAFLMVTVVAITSLRLPVENLYLFLFPISITVLALILLLPPTGTPIDHLSAPQIGHIIVSLAAYTTLMMAACQSLLVVVQERQLRTPGRPAMTLLPPMETMEHLLVAMIWIGFILLSGAVISGYLFFEDVFARQVLHHIVLTSLSWLVYLVFLIGRYFFGWRGLTTVRWTLVAFSLLVLGYLGSKFVLEYVLAP